MKGIVRPVRLPRKPRTGSHPDSYLECMREQTRVLTALAAVAAGAVLAIGPTRIGGHRDDDHARLQRQPVDRRAKR